jgi:UDP-N-acetylglucosamine transferase subunit ALG13
VILVSTGTNGLPFDRLLSVLECIQGDEEMIVQHGPSTVRPTGAICIGAMPYEEFVDAAGRARVLVTHAGVGSILVALMTGHRPILVPRLSAYLEAVDDHQLELAERLAALDAATVVTDAVSLPTVLRKTAGGAHRTATRSGIVDDLERYLATACGVTGPPARQRLPVTRQNP